MSGESGAGPAAGLWSDAVLLEDVLGFEQRAEALASLISSPGTQTPLSVGIFAPSGGGKSTFLRLLESALRGRPGVRAVASLNATHQPGGDLALGLARAILSALQELGPSGEDLSILEALLPPSEWGEFKEALGEALERRLAGGKLCLLVDDVHLASVEGLFRLLMAVTDWLALPGLVFVVAADLGVLTRLLEEHERRVAGDLPEPAIAARARAVLDKLVQLSLSLPSMGREEVERLWGRLVPGASPELVLVAASQPGMNVRRLKQLANNFRLALEMASRSGLEIRPEALLKFLVIRTFWEDVWRTLSTYYRERPSPFAVLQEVALGRASLETASFLESSPFLKRCRDDLQLVALLRMPPHLSEEEAERACWLVKAVSPREEERAEVVSHLVSGDPFKVRLAASVVAKEGVAARGAIVSEILHRAERADMVGKARAAHALWALGPSVPADMLAEVQRFLEGLFSAEEPEAASWAVRAAARICASLDPEASSRLEARILSLKEERYEVGVRAAVAAGLAELGGNIAPHRAERAISALLSLTQDSEPVVRREAVRGLSSVPPPGGKVRAKVADRLLELLHDSDERVVAGAARGLATLLPRLDEGRRELASLSLVEALRKAEGALEEALVPVVEEALEHMPPHIRGMAEEVLSSHEGRS